jgi:hypothetical protein
LELRCNRASKNYEMHGDIPEKKYPDSATGRAELRNNSRYTRIEWVARRVPQEFTAGCGELAERSIGYDTGAAQTSASSTKIVNQQLIHAGVVNSDPAPSVWVSGKPAGGGRVGGAWFLFSSISGWTAREPATATPNNLRDTEPNTCQKFWVLGTAPEVHARPLTSRFQFSDTCRFSDTLLRRLTLGFSRDRNKGSGKERRKRFGEYLKSITNSEC